MARFNFSPLQGKRLENGLWKKMHFSQDAKKRRKEKWHLDTPATVGTVEMKVCLRCLSSSQKKLQRVFIHAGSRAQSDNVDKRYVFIITQQLLSQPTQSPIHIHIHKNPSSSASRASHANHSRITSIDVIASICGPFDDYKWHLTLFRRSGEIACKIWKREI